MQSFEQVLNDNGIRWRLNWEMRGPKDTGVSRVASYLISHPVGSGVVLVTDYGRRGRRNEDGWEVYTHSREVKIDATLADMLRRLHPAQQEGDNGIAAKAVNAAADYRERIIEGMKK